MQFIVNRIINFGIIELFSIFFVLINIFTFVLYVADKRKAYKNEWRISERTLIFFTIACGGVGALLGMLLSRHKTKKLKFRLVAAIGLILALIPIIHITNGLTLGRVIRYVEI